MVIHLSLEDYHNKGLTPEETKYVIESIRDGNSYLWCEPQGINNNWNVRTRSFHPIHIQNIVDEIAYRLSELLVEKGLISKDEINGFYKLMRNYGEMVI
jgi:transcriptional regulator CtsR